MLQILFGTQPFGNYCYAWIRIPILMHFPALWRLFPRLLRRDWRKFLRKNTNLIPHFVQKQWINPINCVHRWFLIRPVRYWFRCEIGTELLRHYYLKKAKSHLFSSHWLNQLKIPGAWQWTRPDSLISLPMIAKGVHFHRHTQAAFDCRCSYQAPL